MLQCWQYIHITASLTRICCPTGQTCTYISGEEEKSTMEIIWFFYVLDLLTSSGFFSHKSSGFQMFCISSFDSFMFFLCCLTLCLESGLLNSFVCAVSCTLSANDSLKPNLQGDILFLHMSKDPIRAGEIVVFNIDVSSFFPLCFDTLVLITLELPASYATSFFLITCDSCLFIAHSSTAFFGSFSSDNLLSCSGPWNSYCASCNKGISRRS